MDTSPEIGTRITEAMEGLIADKVQKGTVAFLFHLYFH